MQPSRSIMPAPLKPASREAIVFTPASGRPTATYQRIAAGPKVARRASGNPSLDETPRAPRSLPPKIARGPAVAAAIRHPGTAARVQDIKGYLAQLRLAHAEGREPRISQDVKFLDLLVAMENDRDPSLRLSAQPVGIAALGTDWAAGLKAVAGLGRAAMEGMDHGSWHAVVSVDDHEMALSARHNPEHPSRVSLVVVDSLMRHLPSHHWKQIAGMMCQHMNDALAKQGKPADARVWLSCLSTSAQKTGEGDAIFALAAVREMPNDADVEKLHEEMLWTQASHPAIAAARVVEDNRYLGARFFKYMALKPSMDALLERRPELEDVPVNRKGDTLRTYQNAHLVSHRPPYSLPHLHNDTYERKRLGAYERLIEQLDIPAPPKVRTRQVMQDVLDEWRLMIPDSWAR